jgi:hypothetical protein
LVACRTLAGSEPGSRDLELLRQTRRASRVAEPRKVTAHIDRDPEARSELGSVVVRVGGSTSGVG